MKSQGPSADSKLVLQEALKRVSSRFGRSACFPAELHATNSSMIIALAIQLVDNMSRTEGTAIGTPSQKGRFDVASCY
jgi:hypothetical protein